jgi:O-antigen ligase
MKINSQSWIPITIALAFMGGAAMILLPKYFLTLLVGVLVLIISMARPFIGLIFLLILIQFPIFENFKAGSFEFSASTIPAVGIALDAMLRRRQRLLPHLNRNQIIVLCMLGVAFLITCLLSSSRHKTLILVPNLILYLLIIYGVMSTVHNTWQLLTLAKVILILGFITVIWPELRLVRYLLGIKSLGVNGLIFLLYPAAGIALTFILHPIEGLASRWKWFSLLVLLLIVYRIYIFEARAGALAIVVLFICSLLAYKSFVRFGYLLLCIAIILSSHFFSKQIIERNKSQTQTTISSFFGKEKDRSKIDKADQVRLYARDAGLRMFKQSPFVGLGPNTYVSMKPKFFTGPSYLVWKTTEGAFNAWIIILAEMGLIGILATGIISVTPILLSLSALRKFRDDLGYLVFSFSLGLIGILIHLFFIDLFYSFAWTYIGLALASTNIGLNVKNRDIFLMTDS